MNGRENKIKNLIETSKSVIMDCCLENGAIVAANSAKPYYSKDVMNYSYVWPRDAFFTCMAADILGMKDVQENYFSWLMERAEGWKQTGLFYEKYELNGLQALHRFQPDQTGCAIISVWNCFRNDMKEAEKYKELIIRSADGLCKAWEKNHFTIPTNDLWEERSTFPELEDFFVYSLCACIKGLLCAHESFPDERYVSKAEEMKDLIFEYTKKEDNLYRSFGKINDYSIDASLLGAVWPFEILFPDDPLAVNTLKLIEDELVKDFGVFRYKGDVYDGGMYRGQLRNKGAGFWPLLNFWMCIVLAKMGRKSEAENYYFKVIDSLENEFIPEQIFSNKIQKSISPLCWSHSMFIIATKELGYL